MRATTKETIALRSTSNLFCKITDPSKENACIHKCANIPFKVKQVRIHLIELMTLNNVLTDLDLKIGRSLEPVIRQSRPKYNLTNLKAKNILISQKSSFCKRIGYTINECSFTSMQFSPNFLLLSNFNQSNPHKNFHSTFHLFKFRPT